MHFKPFFALPVLAAALIANSDAPRQYVLDGDTSDLSAKVSFFGLGSKTMRFPEMDGEVLVDPNQISKATIDVTFDATALEASDETTLNRLKGKRFFWVEQYPTVRFEGSDLKLTTPTEGTFTGQLTARGVTKPETLTVVFDQAPATAPVGEAIGFTATTTIDRRRYGMRSYQLVVGNKVNITMKARMEPRPE